MDTTPIVARLNAIADAVKALKELQLDDFVLFAKYVGDYIAQRQGDESH